MAKLTDKFFNRVIEGDLELGQNENQQIESLLGSGDVPAVKAGEIIESMSGYSATLGTSTEYYNIENVYQGVVKTGNKITFVSAVNFTKISYQGDVLLANFTIPEKVGQKLYPVASSGSLQYILSLQKVNALNTLRITAQVDVCLEKGDNTSLNVYILSNDMPSLEANEKYYLRLEATFLLSDNLIPSA